MKSARKPTGPERVRTAEQARMMLQNAQALMTGWVLRIDQAEIEDAFEPLYNRLDQAEEGALTNLR